MVRTYGFSPIVRTFLEISDENIREIRIKAVKKAINRTLQIANRRAENIEISKIASPAYKSLVNELSEQKRYKFTKFSIARLNLMDDTQRIKAIDVYSRALAFINNKTSSVKGARAFINKIAVDNKIPFTIANNLVDIITEPQITNGNVIVNNWDSERVSGMVSEYTENYDKTKKSQEKFFEEVQTKINNMLNSTNKFDIWDL